MVKAFIWGALNILEVFVKGQSKWPITKTTLNFGMHPHWDAPTTN
jgi:hypothetical protein